MGKSSIKPTAIELRAEVSRYCVIDNNTLTAPNLKAWTISRSNKWLNEHPIVGDMIFCSSKI